MNGQKKPILRILAIETATQACSVALLTTDHNKIVSRWELIPQQHTQRIFPMIREVLSEAGETLVAIDMIAVGRGPGSFTGVRIAVSVAQALGFALNKPVYPISTLAAMAFQNSLTLLPGDTQSVAVSLEARMNEEYVARYEISSMHCRMLEEESIAPKEQGSDTDPTPKIYPHAKEVARLAYLAWQQGDPGISALEVTPLYLHDNLYK